MANSITKKIIAFVIIVVVTVATVLGLYFGGVIAGKPKEYNFKMSEIKGYVDKTEGYPAMLISTKISKDFVEKYNDTSKYTSAEYFTIMFPKEVYQTVSQLGKDTDDRSIYAFTDEEIDNEGVLIFCGDTQKELGEIYQAFSQLAQRLLCAGIRDGEVYYNQAQAGIGFYQYQIDAPFTVLEDNKDVQYFGQCYLKVTHIDGKVEYIFAEVDTENRFCSANNQYS